MISLRAASLDPLAALRRRSNRLIAIAVVAACTGLPTDGSSGGAGGSVIWKVPIKGWTVPAFDDSLAFFGAFAHEIVAVDKRSGTVRWRSQTNGSLERTSGRNVVVVGGTIVGPDDLLYGFDRKTGARKWVFRPDSGFLPGIFFLDTDGKRVYAGSPSGYAYAIDPETGAQIWATNVTGQENSSVYDPVYDNGVVAVTIRRFSTTPVTGGIALLDAATGRVLWDREFQPERAGQGSGANGRAAFFNKLVMISSNDGRVYGLNRTSGEIVWIAPARADIHTLEDVRPVHMAGNTLVVGTTGQSLSGLDTSTGKTLWDTRIGLGSGGDWFTSEGATAYMVNASLLLIAIDGESGRVKWTTPSASSSDDAKYLIFPAVDTDRLYIAGPGGLFALKK